jgi:glycosyltransferase involved in cell wall biosynthesis
MPPTVDIICLSYYDREYLPAFFESLAKSDYPKQLINIIIVDNGSEDGGLEFVKTTNATIIEAGQNLGFGGGCNRGAKHGKAELILFHNADVKLAPDALRLMIKAIESNDVGMCEASLRPSSIKAVGADNSIDWCTGGVLLIKRKLFEQLGGFDEIFFPAYCEDIDLSWLAILEGYKCLRVPEATALRENEPVGAPPKEIEIRGMVKFSYPMRFIYGSINDILSHSITGFRYLVSPKTNSLYRTSVGKGLLMLITHFPYLLKRRMTAQKLLKQSTEKERFVFSMEWYCGRFNG